ncbi:MAG TPA: hypothetical protein VK090_01710 [Paracoccaceae bacterium]|nr:hypothetical protein [Paracoccaceae bacterium]
MDLYRPCNRTGWTPRLPRERSHIRIDADRASDAAADTGVAASNATEGVSIEASTLEVNPVAA